MASQRATKTPILTQVALADDWAAGYVIWRGQKLPPAVVAMVKRRGDKIVGADGWPERRRVMQYISVALKKMRKSDLSRAALLLATDPKDAAACAKIAVLIAAELGMHSQTAAAADAVAGWHALANGMTSDLEDPIKACHAARVGAEIFNRDAAKQKFDAELDLSPIIDNWARVTESDSLGHITGEVHGSVMFRNGEPISTSTVQQFGQNKKWVRTQNTLYRLGYPRTFPYVPPVLRVVECKTRAQAYEEILAMTGVHTLSRNAVEYAMGAGNRSRDFDEMTEDALRVAVELEKQGREKLAYAWHLLTADATDPQSCIGPCNNLNLDDVSVLSAQGVGLISAWKKIRDGKLPVNPLWENKDPFAGAWSLLPEEKPAVVEPASGIVVIPTFGGMKTNSHAKEMAAEFKAIVGKKIPVAPVPDVAAVRTTLVAEFPHAVALIDLMLGDLVGRTHIKFTATLLVGPAGCGKSRLARRIGEACGLYVASYDGAGSSDAAFGGTERRWNSAEPCRPIITIMTAGIANPMMLIDEIDKSSTSKHNGNLANSLLTVIERETAVRFSDPCIEAPVDISHVSYILTANDEKGIPTMLRDRCRLLRMPPITQDHVPVLVAGIVRDIRTARGMDPRWVPPLDGDEIEIARRLLGNGSIRRLQAIIERLLAARETRAMRN